MDSDSANRLEALPQEIQMMLKRKSSRDPNSRFANKLHQLLNFAGNDITRQEFIGAGWTADDNFRINKKRLIQIMEIKLNTLNVNLKDLKFQQLHYDIVGWTLWHREGFTPTSTVDDIAIVKSDKAGNSKLPANSSLSNGSTFSIGDNDSVISQFRDGPKSDKLSIGNSEEMQQSKLAIIKDITLGKCDTTQTQKFKRATISIWEEILESNNQQHSVSGFIQKAAIRFRESHQRLDNAKDILNRILICQDQSQISLVDFAIFMARFGPEETLMLKVGSLLKSSNQNLNWLRLVTSHDSIPGEPDSNFYGFFDDTCQNGFVLHHSDGSKTIVYNIVDAPSTESYLVDANNNRYSSWQDYFTRNPVNATFNDYHYFSVI